LAVRILATSSMLGVPVMLKRSLANDALWSMARINRGSAALGSHRLSGGVAEVTGSSR
jgi:hypothetical protein